MFDEPVSGVGGRRKTAWQTRIKTAFDGRFTDLAHAVSPEADADDITFKLLFEGQNSLGLKASVAPKAVYLKVYDGPAHQVSELYAREKKALLMLRDTDIAVQLLTYNDELRFLLTQYEERKLAYSEFVDSFHLKTLQDVGEWIADLDATLPNQPAYGTWYSYLKKFGDDLNQQVVDEAREDLSAVPILGIALARNNPILSDYVVDRNSRLRGCNFEAACVRPLGWDYVLTYLAICEKYGGDAADALEALSAGFERKHKGALLTDELNTVARVLLCARAAAMCDRRDVEDV